MSITQRRAAFLDRDGTIIEDVEYIGDPDRVVLLPGAADAIRALNEARIPVIVITNQSGIARGLFTERDYEAVRERIDSLLAAQGAHIDATYMCPHHPDFDGGCDCRKPSVMLHRRAATEHGIDLTRSIFVGDRWRDVEPAMTLGGKGILIDRPSTPGPERQRAREEGVPVVHSLEEAVRRAIPTTGSKSRIAVLASGGGSNLQAILDHFDSLGETRGGDVVLVVSDRADAGALDRARRRNISAQLLATARTAEGVSLEKSLADHDIDLIVLAGYLRLVPPEVVQAYDERIVNIHPSLLPAFGGHGMYGMRVHRAVLDAGATVTGATVHFVNEEFDRGRIIAQWPVPVIPGDDPARLAARVLRVEHLLFPRVVDAVARGCPLPFDRDKVLSGDEAFSLQPRSDLDLATDIERALGC